MKRLFDTVIFHHILTDLSNRFSYPNAKAPKPKVITNGLSPIKELSCNFKYVVRLAMCLFSPDQPIIFHRHKFWEMDVGMVRQIHFS
jgi:hypothetical protein